MNRVLYNIRQSNSFISPMVHKGYPRSTSQKAEEAKTSTYKSLIENLKPLNFLQRTYMQFVTGKHVLTFYPFHVPAHLSDHCTKKMCPRSTLYSFRDGFKTSKSVTHRSSGNVLPGYSTPSSKRQWFTRWCSSFTKSQTQRWKIPCL